LGISSTRYLQKNREDKRAAAKKIDEYRRKFGGHLQDINNEQKNGYFCRE
jgi:hypothetical protein